MIWILKSLI